MCANASDGPLCSNARSDEVSYKFVMYVLCNFRACQV